MLPGADLRSATALEPQDVALFADTVAENIRYGSPDASMDAVRRKIAGHSLTAPEVKAIIQDLAAFRDARKTPRPTPSPAEPSDGRSQDARSQPDSHNISYATQP